MSGLLKRLREVDDAPESLAGRRVRNPDGHEAAERIETLEAELTSVIESSARLLAKTSDRAAELRGEVQHLTAERDGLAKALKQALLFAETRRDEALWFVQENRTARDLGRGEAFMEMCRHLSATLAALPVPPEQDGDEQ